MANIDVQMTLKDGVQEIITLMTGLDLEFDPAQDRFHVLVRCINKAMRSVALEHEWSYYSSQEELGVTTFGQIEVELNSRQRLRLINDDALRLNDSDGKTWRWVYILPRDALHKYQSRRGLWCAATRSTLVFSRPIQQAEAGLHILAPVMREPKMFAIPESGEEVSSATLNQLIDFDYPDLVLARAAFLYAQSDPVMQPRVPSLEEQYKDIMYQLTERDTNVTDTPYINEFFVPIQNSVLGVGPDSLSHGHPHSDERML